MKPTRLLRAAPNSHPRHNFRTARGVEEKAKSKSSVPDLRLVDVSVRLGSADSTSAFFTVAGL